MLTKVVNEVLGDHNVEKQMTDSRGDVRIDLPDGLRKTAELYFYRWLI